MFYEQIVLAKQGPLGNVWLAAHWEKKLSKQQINDTNIPQTVEQLTNPRAPMALRLSGHLLLGVVRIYYKQVEYLYQDCSEALVKIKMAFRPGSIDMDESVANLNAITMPETFGDFEIILPGDITTDLLPDAEEGLITINLNTARVSDITIAADVDDIRHTIAQPPMDDMLSQQDISSVASAFDPFNPDVIAPPEITGDDTLAPPIDIITAAGDLLPPPVEDTVVAPPEPQLPTNLFEPVSSSVSSEKELAIENMPELAPAAQRLRNKRYKVDKRTELSKKVMLKTIEDPAPLLRPLERAPPTREVMRERMEGLDRLSSLFSVPMDNQLGSKLRKVIERTMKFKESWEIPKGVLEDSLEEQRGAAGPSSPAPPLLPPPDVPTDMPPLDASEVAPPLMLVEDAMVSGDTTGGADTTAPDAPAGPPDVTGPSITGEDEGREGALAGGLIITKRTAAMHHFLSKNLTKVNNN